MTAFRIRRLSYAATLFTAASLCPSMVTAQRQSGAAPTGIQSSQDLGQGIVDAVKLGAEVLRWKLIHRSEDTVHVAVTSVVAGQGVTATFTNRSNDTVYVAPVVQYAPPPPDIDPMSELLSTDTLDVKLAAERAHDDSMATLWSLASWISNVPDGFWLKPRESRTLTLPLTVPVNPPPGEYSAHLMAVTILPRPPRLSSGRATYRSVTTREGQDPEEAWNAEASEWAKDFRDRMSSRTGGPAYARSAAKIVYKVGTP